MRISSVASTENFESYVAPKYELRTASVQEASQEVPLLVAEKLELPDTSTVPAKEHLLEKETKIAPTSASESAAQNLSVVGIQVSPSKKSDTAETQVKHAINTADKQKLTVSEAISNSEKSNDNLKTENSHNSSKEKKTSNMIEWVATGKTVVLTKNVETKKVSLFQIFN